MVWDDVDALGSDAAMISVMLEEEEEVEVKVWRSRRRRRRGGDKGGL